MYHGYLLIKLGSKQNPKTHKESKKSVLNRTVLTEIMQSIDDRRSITDILQIFKHSDRTKL